MLRIYYYVFYKFYKFLLLSPITKGWTKDKAIILILALELITLYSIIFYSDTIFEHHSYLTFFSFKVLVPFIAMIAIKWFLFSRNDNWKQYVAEFDQLPKSKNRKGTWLIIVITLLLIANFVLSVYLDPYIHKA